MKKVFAILVAASFAVLVGCTNVAEVDEDALLDSIELPVTDSIVIDTISTDTTLVDTCNAVAVVK